MMDKTTVRYILVIGLVIILLIGATLLYFMLLPSKKTTEKVNTTENVLTVTDDYNRNITFNKTPERLISLAPSVTEILYFIGVFQNLVGVDNNSDYPEQAKNITKVAGFGWINYELITSLKPDLIIAADINKAQIPDLESRGYKVVVFAPKTVYGMLDNLLLAGKIMDKEDYSKNVVHQLKNRIVNVTKKASNITSKPKIYIEFDTHEGYWTFGPGSFGDSLITLAGGINIAGNESQPYVALQSETVILANPDIIIYTTNPWITTTKDTIKNRTGWNNINAVKNDKIYSIEDNLVSRPGPRLVDGLEEINRIIVGQ